MKEFSKIKKLLMILIIFLTIIWLSFHFTKNYVIIRFDELGALSKNMIAYYNGFRVGKIVRIEPDNDYKHTLVKVNLIPKNLNLPQNTKVQVESFPSGELYLNFIYPSSPSFTLLKRGDIIEGIVPYSLEQFMMGQNISGMSDIVSIYVIRALKATEVANIEMTTFFKNTSKVINENSNGIKRSVNNTEAATKNLALMAENLNQASKKLNNALDESTLKASTTNIKDSTSNIKSTTNNLYEATKDFDKTMKKIDDTISEVNSTAENLNSISSGLNETLSKRFAGMRIMFGTPVKAKKCVKNACE